MTVEVEAWCYMVSKVSTRILSSGRKARCFLVHDTLSRVFFYSTSKDSITREIVLVPSGVSSLFFFLAVFYSGDFARLFFILFCLV